MIDQEFVQYIVSSLVSKPDEVRVERTVDERGVLLTLHVAEEDLGRVIGRKGSTAQSLRVLLRALGSKNEAHYNLRIADDKNGGGESPRPAEEKSPVEEKSQPAEGPESIESDFADDSEEEAETEEPAEDDSLLDKTRKELDDLNDLDI